MKRLHHIDALRGLAALAVAWFHFAHGGRLLAEDSLVTRSASYGWLGVEVFFVISGFILPYTMARGGYRIRDFGTFVKKRIVRLDPPYFVAIALALVLWWVSDIVPAYQGEPFVFEPIRFLLHVGYLNAFFDYSWYNVVFWTLALEFQFYLLLAVGFPALLHRSALVRIGSLAVMCALAFLIPNANLVFHYLGFFALGAATAHYALGHVRLTPYLVILGAMAVATALATTPVAAGVGLAAALVIAFVRIPEIKPLAWLGAVSYSLYLLHVPIGGRIVNLGGRFVDTFPLQMAVLILALVGSFIAADLLYRFVELPSQRFSSSIRYRRRSKQAESVAGERVGEHATDAAVRGAEVSVP